MFEVTETRRLKRNTVTDSEGKEVKLEIFREKKSGHLVAVEAAFLEKNGWLANPCVMP